ncbi:LPS export ABC transporter periplasmic protein LptC [Paraflavisolibacter sp. H34]|uniref:LPS export ABC transporter periplasmic protein LptC n=1 Tax=Huijunlia imazamoxiresistens TaxID=3127457 RepID=UPI00301AF8FA
MTNQFFLHNRIFLQAAILGSCLFVWGCENDPAEVNAWNEKKVMLEEAKKVEAIFSQEGNLKAQLTAPRMLRYQADTVYVEFPNTLHVNFYDSSGKLESQLDARYGKYFESRNRVFLRDSVVAYNIKGDTVRSPELWWDQNTKKFYTDKTVRITQADKRIVGGKGFEAEQDMSAYDIMEPTGTVVAPEGFAP